MSSKRRVAATVAADSSQPLILPSDVEAPPLPSNRYPSLPSDVERLRHPSTVLPSDVGRRIELPSDNPKKAGR